MCASPPGVPRVKFALSLLKKGPWEVLPADKDGCFVLADKEEWYSIQLEVMMRWLEYVYPSKCHLLAEDLATWQWSSSRRSAVCAGNLMTKS